MSTYRLRDEKASKQVPEGKEEEYKNECNVVVWSQCYSHHSIQREVYEAH